MIQDLISHIVGAIASPERLNASVIAMIVVALFGLLFGAASGNANPYLWGMLEKVFGGFTRKTYKVGRSVSSLQFRGAVLLTLYLLITGIVAAIAVLFERHFHLAGFMDPFLLTLTLSGGATWASLVKLHHALRAEEKKGQGLPKGSFYEVAVSTRSNLNTTDNHGIIRTGIGFVATSFDKGLIAPLFWYLMGGLPAAYIYCGIAAARWSLSKEGFAKGIGTLALKLEEFFGFFPQLVSAFILAFAALITPSAGFVRSFIGMCSRTGNASYAEGGLPVTTLAWGLGVSLGGPVEDVDGSVLRRAWVGAKGSTAQLERHHLRRAIYLSIVSYFLTFFLLLVGVVGWKMVHSSF
jgi:adenosylcobinamide-phosphate synthase